MSKPKLICTVGISNSGKTTWAEEQVSKSYGSIVNLNRDDVRATLAYNINNYKFSRSKEAKVTEIIRVKAEKASIKGLDIIISDSNLNPKTLASWFWWAEDHGYQFEKKFFDIEPHVSKKRNLKRHHTIPESAIDKQYIQYRAARDMKFYESNEELPKAVIFDVDRTLADMGDSRGAFEWDKVHLDKVKKSVKTLLCMYNTRLYNIIILSGRDGCCKEQTAKWLVDNGIPFDYHYQRSEGDTRPDAVVKEEIFFDKINGNFNVELVVDDRNQMVSRWRALGLECWQVAEGDF